jgi:hypothetical protein
MSMLWMYVNIVDVVSLLWGRLTGEEYEKCQLEGVHRGSQAGEYNKWQKWLAEGHGPGLCISKEAHTHELWQATILLNDARIQVWVPRFETPYLQTSI